MTTPARPALSGPGSSAAAWRVYAATVSNMGGWDEMTRDEIITLLQEGGYLDAEGNALTPAPKASTTSDQAAPAQPEEPTSDGSTESPPATPGEPSGGSSSRRGLVDEPCRVCYPGGWPAKQPGSSASCHHGLAIVQGQAVEISLDQAIAMGFAKEGD